VTQGEQPGESSLVDGVCELTLETSDRSALEAFYGSALGLEVLSLDGDRTWLACGPRARLGLWTPARRSSVTRAVATSTSRSP
jgi:catechol-2,3-dioxygenase